MSDPIHTTLRGTFLGELVKAARASDKSVIHTGTVTTDRATIDVEVTSERDYRGEKIITFVRFACETPGEEIQFEASTREPDAHTSPATWGLSVQNLHYRGVGNPAVFTGYKAGRWGGHLNLPELTLVTDVIDRMMQAVSNAYADSDRRSALAPTETQADLLNTCLKGQRQTLRGSGQLRSWDAVRQAGWVVANERAGYRTAAGTVTEAGRAAYERVAAKYGRPTIAELDLRAVENQRAETLQRAVNDATVESFALKQSTASALSTARGELTRLLDTGADVNEVAIVANSIPQLYHAAQAAKQAHLDDLAAARARLTAQF